jgi:hypothetical protein
MVAAAAAKTIHAWRLEWRTKTMQSPVYWYYHDGLQADIMATALAAEGVEARVYGPVEVDPETVMMDVRP